MIERKICQGVVQSYICLKHRLGSQKMTIAKSDPVTPHEIAATIDDGTLEIGPGLNDRLPPFEHLNKRVVHSVLGSRTRAEHQRRSTDLTRDLSLVERCKARTNPASALTG